MKRFPAILCMLLIGSVAIAHQKPFRFQHITAKDGLSQGHVLCMIQDSRGYIWAGTYHGLNRYNGYSFDVFYADDHNKPGSLFIDVVSALYEDSRGKIWCGTWGVDVYDPDTETFSHVITAGEGPDAISENEISAILEDGEGNIWISTLGGGLYRYTPGTKKIKAFRQNDTTAHSLSSDIINDIALDNDHSLWIATEDAGLSRMNLQDGSLTHYMFGPPDPKEPSERGISCLYIDQAGTLWLGGNQGYLSRYNRETDSFKTFKCCPEQFETKRARIMQIMEDWDKHLLLATNGAGLISFDPGDGSSEICLHSSDNKESLLSNENYSILIDRNQTLFVGSFGRGISKYSPFSNKFDVFQMPSGEFPTSDINAFTDAIEDSKGNLVVGTYYGFLVFDQNTWEYEHFLPGDNYESNKVLTLELAPDGTIWICTQNGIHRYSKDYRKLRTYNPEPCLKDQSVYAIEFDCRNTLWIGLFRKGLLRIDEEVWRDQKRSTLDFRLYQVDYNDPASIAGNQQWVIREDEDSILWIGGVGGLCRYNADKDSFTRVFTSGSVKTLDKDIRGDLWIGTIGKGLYHLQASTGRLQKYTTAEGLNHSFLYGIMGDPSGHIWMTSEAGISRLQPWTGTFRNFDVRDGLTDDHFDDKAYSKLSGGRFYMGTNNGFVIFKPETIRDDTSSCSVVLTELRIDNRKIDFIYDEVQKKNHSIHQLKQITLQPDQRDIEFSFAALHFAAPHKIQYKYKLQGYDQEWIYTHASHRLARYTNLSPGKYTFIVYATNSDGYWTGEPLKIEVIVVTPFYKTKLFIFSMLILAVIFMYLIFRWRMSAVVRQKRKLENIVGQRTREVQKKNRQLQRIADNLKEANMLLEEGKQQIQEQAEELASQRDELASSNATKDRLFSIIAHDLKNPFNVLLGYSELLLVNYADWKDEKKIHFLTLLKETSQNAFNLLENLLQWSRSHSGMLKFSPVPLNPVKIIDATLAEVRSMADKKTLNIMVNTDQVSKRKIRADKDMIQVILRNLITNAIKFSKPGSDVMIEVLAEDDLAHFSIKDKGVGMSKEDLANLFVFEKKSSTPGTEGEKGTGLGLILCSEFVKHHGGRIWAESTLKEGTCFHFTIPLDKA